VSADNSTLRRNPGRRNSLWNEGVRAVAALLIFGWVTTPAQESLHTVTYPTRTMGTYANVTLVVADSAAAAPTASAAHGTFQRVDSLMSNWTTTSEVARINRMAGVAGGAPPPALTVEPEVARVLEAALRVGLESGGAFDVTVEPLVRAWGFLGGQPHVPGEAEAAQAFALVGQRHLDFTPASRQLRFRKGGVHVDLGGIAKGYAVDAVADTLRARGVENALVDLSGNMWARTFGASACATREIAYPTSLACTCATGQWPPPASTSSS